MSKSECSSAQHALPPDAAPLRFAAQVKRKPFGVTTAGAETTTTEARRIIESLADGRCPVTDRPLSPDNLWQQPVVVEALRIAARALERVELLEQRQQNLPERTGRAWDSTEEQQLCAEFDAGKSVAEIAQIHQQTRGAIQSRLRRLGKIPQQR